MNVFFIHFSTLWNSFTTTFSTSCFIDKIVSTSAAGGQYIAVPAGQILAHPAAVPSMTVAGAPAPATATIPTQAGVAQQLQTFKQIDGVDGSSSDDEDEEEDDDEFVGLGAAGGPSTTLTMEGEDDEEDILGSGEGEGSGGPKEEEEPLNSGDDVSDEETEQLFDTDNVVVCQYDKVSNDSVLR